MMYTIRKGDELKNIAARYLGDSRKWPVIWERNKNTLRSGNPHRVYPGEVIDIPDQEPPPPVPVENAPALAPDEVALIVNGVRYSGWESVGIKQSFEAISGSFDVSLAELWDGQKEPWPIFDGDRVKVLIGTDVVCDGWVDDAPASVDATSHTLSVSGRDRTCDLVDCSAINRPGEWKGKDIIAIAKDLCSPFGIEAKADIGIDTGEPLKSFRLQPGETVFEALDRLAKGRGLIITGSGGTIRFTKSGDTKLSFTLREGENLKKIESTSSSKDRFSECIVEGSEGPKGRKASAKDPNIKRYRPIVIQAEEQASLAYCKTRAEWEVKVRAARGSTATAVVVGWRDPDGNLWRPNTIVTVESKSARISGEMMISDVSFERSADSGTTTTLGLKRPDAFSEEPKVKNDPVKR